MFTPATLVLCLPAVALCLPQLSALVPANPTVIAPSPKATYIGSSSSQGIDTFNGIPFAVPPVGTNRLFAPSSITTALGTVHATGTPQSCPQQGSAPPTADLPPAVAKLVEEIPLYQSIQSSSEDCLTLNIQRPSNTSANAKLPVVYWIYGGGFEAGSTSSYDASTLIATSVKSGLPIMYVAVNYRLSGWGFLNGKEVQKAGVSNLGLLDQRLGLQWVADNIARFGGDPTKVTIWGESAGSISVFDQMALYDGDHTYRGKPLFRGAVMDSGSIVPADPVNGTKGQAVYDQVVNEAGCSKAADTLACLRTVSYDTFSTAVNSLPGLFSYDSIALAYLPRPDGVVLTHSPEVLLQTGKYAKVPFIIGDQEDEGPLFSLVQSNLTTTQDVVQYLSTVFFPEYPVSRIRGLVNTYPDKAAAGSPFRTGDLNELYPQYKRLAAILGDITFTLTRRIFLAVANIVTPSVPSWSYLASYLHGTPILGTFHGSDILIAYGEIPGVPASTIMSYYISFFNTLNPNTKKSESLPTWPQWKVGTHRLLNFKAQSNGYVVDDFRNASYSYLIDPANTIRI